MSLNRNQLHTHVEDGGTYVLTATATLMKHPETGVWLAAVHYRDADPHSVHWNQHYSTTEDRWLAKFKVLDRTPPLQGQPDS